ncbi:hypothetical protein N7G274_010464 [Stereocaulon virgatum]|uniref:Uncharacterized protein n=1 Tax=Stereocaulon virgatum TaxID=373712 RepID=A0ABR3ZV99_9LECA
MYAMLMNLCHAPLSVVMLSTSRDMIMLQLSLNGGASPLNGNTLNQSIKMPTQLMTYHSSISSEPNLRIEYPAPRLVDSGKPQEQPPTHRPRCRHRKSPNRNLNRRLLRRR